MKDRIRFIICYILFFVRAESYRLYSTVHRGAYTNSFKFHELIVERNNVIVRYGCIDAPGNPTMKDFPTIELPNATSFALKTVKEKEKKGNSPVNTEETIAAAPISSSSSISLANQQIIIRLNEDFPTGYDPSEEIERGNIVYVEESAIGGDGATTTAASSNSAKNTSIKGKLSLAHSWKNDLNPHGYFMSEKLDGMRAYWHDGKLWTRSGKVIHAPEWFIAGLPTEEDLDGELFLGRQQFGACMSIARRLEASNEWKQLKYVIFDCPTVLGGIQNRLRRAQELFQEYHPLYAVIHPHEICQGKEHLLQELTRVEQLGGEGMMLRHPTASHRGGRTNDLLKVKSFADDEGYVIDYEAGKGKYTGMVGSLICITKTGLTFKVGSGLSDYQRSYSTAPKIGTVITYKYFELTKDGIPRFPIFMRIRPDVDKCAFPTVRE